MPVLAALACFALAKSIGDDGVLVRLVLSALTEIAVAAVRSQPFCAAVSSLAINAIDAAPQTTRSTRKRQIPTRAEEVSTMLVVAAASITLSVVLGRDIALAERVLSAMTKVAVAAIQSSAFCVAVTTVVLRRTRR